jgi:hypothetical protein
MKIFLWGLAFLVVSAGSAVAGEFRQAGAKLGARPVSMWAGHGVFAVQFKSGKTLGLAPGNSGIVRAKAPAKPKSVALPKGTLPDGVVTRGNGEIRKAWLIRPVRRYGHGVLGDKIEAGGVRVETDRGQQFTYLLTEDEVFEDRYARIADLDGDGHDEVIIVNSHLAKGAALAVFGIRKGALIRLARTPFIGTAHRWLNPAGIADFDSDGRKEIAIVVTPHIGGTLQFWDYSKGKLRLQAKRFGFSNHFIGSRIQMMSTILQKPGGGKPILVLPGAKRNALYGITLAKGKISVEWKHVLSAQVVTEIVQTASTKKIPAIAAGLSNNTMIVLY